MCVIVTGASCSGKSTLSEQLIQKLGKSWAFLEFDEIEQKLKDVNKNIEDESVIKELVRQSNIELKNGKNIIVDTNVYTAQLEKIDSKDKKTIFVYCPIEELLRRNSLRDADTKRSTRRAYYAKQYVIKTHQKFEKFNEHDLKLDSSKNSKEESLEQALRLIS